MNDKCFCGMCGRMVPVNLDRTLRRHTRPVPVGSGQIPCPGGSYNLHPLLFSDPMIRAILEGRKTVTRRMDPRGVYLGWRVGDRVWTRETWGPYDQGAFGQPHTSDPPEAIIYRADGSARIWDGEAFVPGSACSGDAPDDGRWRPSIHMPYAAHRILLELTEPTRREPVRIITDEEAVREGAYRVDLPGWTMGLEWGIAETPRDAFHVAWDQLHPRTWNDAEPVRIEFRVLHA